MDKCPVTARIQEIDKSTRQCDGTVCAGGCCPEPGWVCCDDNLYCAETAVDCPYDDIARRLLTELGDAASIREVDKTKAM